MSTASLWWEASRVIAMRAVILAAGGKAGEAENERLIPEKIAALIDAQIGVATDVMLGRAHRSPQNTMSLYRRRVRSNYRRVKRGAGHS
jgi:hypothetical protein